MLYKLANVSIMYMYYFYIQKKLYSKTQKISTLVVCTEYYISNKNYYCNM